MTQQAATYALRIEISSRGTEAICKCTGKLNSDSSARLKAEVKALLPHHRRIVLDLAHVVSMDSSGLGAVVSLYVSAHSAKCEFQLVNFNERVRELLGLTKLLSAFETCGQYMIKMP